MTEKDGVSAYSAVSHSPAEQSGAQRELAQAVASVIEGRTTVGAWDPYEIWLTRVKRPRDQRVVGATGA